MNNPEILIHDLSRGGAGVGTLPSGKRVFVPQTAPGDRVRVRVTTDEKRFAEAETEEVLERSSTRTEPRCAVFGRCGGCEWQHLPYGTQWETKKSGVQHALKRVQLGSAETIPWEEFPAESAYGYRNRVQVRTLKGQLGFYARRSHTIVDIASCPIARPEINETIEKLRLSPEIQADKEHKLELALMPSGQVEVFRDRPHAAAGFRQINDEQNKRLQDWIGENYPDGYAVLDLFGGDGNLSRGLWARAPKTEIIDRWGTLSADAPSTVQLTKKTALEWAMLTKRAESSEDGTPVFAIIDPPRQGLWVEGVPDFVKQLTDALRTTGVTKMVLVGCEPDAWARDLSRLESLGAHVEKAAVFDFFPQTHHVESAAVLYFH